MDTTKFTYFVLLNNHAAGFSFLAQYYDKNGDNHEIVNSIDQFGNKTYRRFKWTGQNRAIRIPNKQEKEIEFLRNHPLCEDSPNNGGGIIKFKELNDAKGARIALEAKRVRAEAESIALKLEPEDIDEFALLIGSPHEDEALQAHAVAEYAGNNPEHFLQLYNDPARNSRSLYKKAKNAGILKNKGFMIFWENVHLGNGEENAIQKIYEDKQLAEALREQLKREGSYS
jgi:hypothetical protein